MNYNLIPASKQENPDVIDVNDITHIIKTKTQQVKSTTYKNKILKILTRDQKEMLTKEINKIWNKQSFPPMLKQKRS